MEYPKVLEGNFEGRPLKLLAQLNFEKLPHLEGFPKKGILQFFAGCDDDDVYGINFDDGLYPVFFVIRTRVALCKYRITAQPASGFGTHFIFSKERNFTVFCGL